MSDTSSSASIAEQAAIANYIFFATTSERTGYPVHLGSTNTQDHKALTSYEYLITIKTEAEIIFKKRLWTMTTILLLATRWTFLCSNLFGLIPLNPSLIFWATLSSCTGGIVLEQICYLLGFLEIAIFSSMRVYATSERNLPITLFVFFLEITPFVEALVTNAQETIISLNSWPITGCTVADPTNWPLVDKFTTYIASMLDFGRFNSARYNVAKDCLLRDGTWFFVALLVGHILQATLPSESLSSMPFVSEITATLPPLLMNRFMINLRSAAEPGDSYAATSSFHPSRISIPNFRAVASSRFLGNIGEDLDVGDARPESNEERAQDMELTSSFDGEEGLGTPSSAI
ncbi:hypothetical protein PHLGIDRAFT_14527 [Phlebiopsis gigantea 11061_1 CR5-6]|uniref:Uncharacterized protein n=1 Tax=Phlebiopsis gigantea (strain 11061_1 CR5-6) TaxID=745531 RepID=A0A0C3PHR1_PHLG1|nr:hypothetical protein PHLGIDRAFT_14527 [Phlebiopsis gigantea 11061_1 CR5-6]